MYPQYDINLLPKKEKKNMFVLLLILLCFFACIAITAYIYVATNQVTKEKQSVQYEVATLQKQLETIGQEVAIESKAIDVQQLKNQVEVLESAPAHTVKLLEEVTKALPSRGFVTNFSYTQFQTVSLSVQFDIYREAAYFQKRLEEEAWVSAVSLTNITAAELPAEEEEEMTEEVLPRFVAQYTITYDSTAWIEEKEENE